jgi:hypothetical protein
MNHQGLDHQGLDHQGLDIQVVTSLLTCHTADCTMPSEEVVLYPAIAQHQSKEAADRLIAETQAVKEVLADLNAANDPADPQVSQLVDRTIQVRASG